MILKSPGKLLTIAGKLFLFLYLILTTLFSVAQTDSCRLRISLLTCSPGEELYSGWGHTAIRVIDSAKDGDYVFNYGTFDDSDPDFYLKFTRGEMWYALSVESFADFMVEYQYEHRSVIEQVLQLSCAEKKQLLAAMATNAQEANRFYSYYFLSDNCTTRAKDIIKKNAGAPVVFKSIIPGKPPTYRQMLHVYLDKGKQYWSEFGIDILLGSNLDKRVNNEQAMFLPDYLLKGFDSATVNNHPLVAVKQTILNEPVQPERIVWFTPITFFMLLFVIIVLLTFAKARWAKVILNIFDVTFFLALGLLGVLLLILWITRVDTVCRNNYNLLWALPTHVVMAFLLFSKKLWVKKYFRITAIICLLLAVAWFFMPQQLNVAILPLLATIIIRSYNRGKGPIPV